MKILWMSDEPTGPTGFGNVTQHVCAGLAEYGHQVSILGWPGQGQPRSWKNCTLYPIRQGPHGADVLPDYLRRLQPDVLVILDDIWRVSYMTRPALADFMQTLGIPWAFYYPIDSDMGEGRLPANMLHVLKAADLPIAMSRYGRDVAQANGVISAYIPHGVDTTIFQPPVDKVCAKRMLGYERRFVVLSDARNQPRKLLPRTLEIFRRFAADKDDVLLHLHCDPDDPGSRIPVYFYDLRSDIEFLNLTNKVQITKGMSIAAGLPITRLAEIYQAADVHLLSSWGEGFGLPTLQAAAAGVVPMASAYSASHELVLHHGEAISVRHFLRSPSGLRYALIDIDDAASKLEKLYRDRELLAFKAQRARDFALKYDWKCVVRQWHELLEREVPRKKNSLHALVNASRITLYHPRLEYNESDPAWAEYKSVPLLPGDEQLTGDTAGCNADELVAGAPQATPELTDYPRIPIALPLRRPKQAKERIAGYVYAASEWDLPVVLALSHIFPGLTVWSTVALGLASSQSDGKLVRPGVVQAKIVQADSAEYQSHLAASTLALDIAGFDTVLPARAAELDVPCIALARSPKQTRLWPALSLAKTDPVRAAELGRQLLTDRGVAMEVCRYARQQLAGMLASATSPLV
jgi:glycosyltransferase involved in cell wall biosynthesis